MQKYVVGLISLRIFWIAKEKLICSKICNLKNMQKHILPFPIYDPWESYNWRTRFREAILNVSQVGAFLREIKLRLQNSGNLMHFQKISNKGPTQVWWLWYCSPASVIPYNLVALIDEQSTPANVARRGGFTPNWQFWKCLALKNYPKIIGSFFGNFWWWQTSSLALFERQ